jgi:hypothetical protein
MWPYRHSPVVNNSNHRSSDLQQWHEGKDSPDGMQVRYLPRLRILTDDLPRERAARRFRAVGSTQNGTMEHYAEIFSQWQTIYFFMKTGIAI